MTKKTEEEIEEKILLILDSGILMSITKVTKELNNKYSIKISPQITKRYLLQLEKEGKIVKKDG